MLQSRNQGPNSEEPFSAKISRTEAKPKSIIGGFEIGLSSHLWACPYVAYSKSWLTRASKGAFHSRQSVSHHFQQTGFMLLGNTSAFKRQQVRTSRTVENMRAHLFRFIFHMPVQRSSLSQWFDFRTDFLLGLIIRGSVTEVEGPDLLQSRTVPAAISDRSSCMMGNKTAAHGADPSSGYRCWRTSPACGSH